MRDPVRIALGREVNAVREHGGGRIDVHAGRMLAANLPDARVSGLALAANWRDSSPYQRPRNLRSNAAKVRHRVLACQNIVSPYQQVNHAGAANRWRNLQFRCLLPADSEVHSSVRDRCHGKALRVAVAKEKCRSVRNRRV